MIISLDLIDGLMKVAEDIEMKDQAAGTETVIINQKITPAGTIPAETILAEIIQEIIPAEITRAGITQAETIQTGTILLAITQIEIITVETSLLLLVSHTICKTTVTMIINRQCIYDSSINGRLQSQLDVPFCCSCFYIGKSTKSSRY